MLATIMPGFTHMQTAQPITFGHHCLAYVEMFARDRGRFADAAQAAERIAAGRGGAGGNLVSHRPRGDGADAGLCAADAQFARRGLGARFRAGISGGGHHRGDEPVAAGGRDGAMVFAGFRLS